MSINDRKDGYIRSSLSTIFSSIYEFETLTFSGCILIKRVIVKIEHLMLYWGRGIYIFRVSDHVITFYLLQPECLGPIRLLQPLPPPTILCWVLTRRVRVSAGETSGRCLSRVRRALMNQMNALIQGSRGRGGDAVKRWLSGNGVFTGTWSWSPQPPDCEKLVFVGYKPPSVWYFLCQSKQTKTTWHKAFLPRMFLTHFFHSLLPLPPLSLFLPSLPTGKMAINSHC